MGTGTQRRRGGRERQRSERDTKSHALWQRQDPGHTHTGRHGKMLAAVDYFRAVFKALL